MTTKNALPYSKGKSVFCFRMEEFLWRFTTHIGFTKEYIRNISPYPEISSIFYCRWLPGYFLLWGLLLQPFPEMVRGLMRILLNRIFDYGLCGPSAVRAQPLSNASLITLMCIALMYFLNMNIEGSSIAALSPHARLLFIRQKPCQYMEHHPWRFLFMRNITKNPFIQLPLYGFFMAQVCLQSLPNNPIRPFFSLPVRLAMSLLVGIIIGFVMPPLCAIFIIPTKVIPLYNGGFTAGIIATVIISIYKSFWPGP